MKFQCDRCKTRYSIGEEKIRGKVLKIRCKNCSAVITVREGQSATTGVEAKSGKQAAPAASRSPRAEKNGTGSKKAAAPAAASPVLEDAFNRAMSRLPTPDPAKDLRGDDESTGRAAQNDLMGLDTSDADGDEGPPLETEWYVSIDGDQEGPFSLAQAQKRVGKKQPQEEMHAWQEGFDDWLPVDRVPELAAHVPVPPAARRARASAPPIPGDAKLPMAARGGGGGALSAASAKAAAASSKSPASDEGSLSLAALAKASSGADAGSAADEGGGGGDFDFDIGEASRVVKLPMLMPPPRGDAAASGNMARAGLPGMGGGNGAARGTGGMPAMGGVVGDDVNISAAVLIPPKRNKHGLIFWIGGGAFSAIMAVLLVILLRGGDSNAEVNPGDSPTSSFVEGFYNDDNNIGVIPGLPLPAKEPGSELVPGVKKPSIIAKRPVIKAPALGTDPGRPRIGETFDDPTLGRVGERDAEEVLDAQRRYGSGLKWCFERALKLNPDLKGRSNRYDVQITITAAGAVRSVSVGGGDKDLKECVRQKVASWGFKPASGDFTTQFPIVFN